MGAVHKNKRVSIFIVGALCVTFSYQLTLTPSQRSRLVASTTAFTPKLRSADDILVDETDQLIKAGESITIFDKSKTDIVLVIGNTGAGKTTIAKFLAEVERLEAYDAGDGILIRDTDQKISVNSTIVSKTIFPDLIIDNATNTAFYDLPGFSDTRNASVEIANAAFMKKVADHAQRVKLLFIVNYNSLRNGRTRIDFKKFLEHATDLIRNPAKFKLAMALVATKVQVDRTRENIVNGIGAFLHTVKLNLPEVISDVRKRKAAEDLIDGITSKDSFGNYNRISYFKQPTNLGPLTQLPEVMDQREHIENILQNKIKFVEKSPEDFGFSVSPEARLVITKLSDRVNHQITKTMESIGAKFKTQFNSTVSSSPLEAVGGIIEEQELLQKMAASLTTFETFPEFLVSMMSMTYHLQMQNATSEEILDLLHKDSSLDFLEQISGLTLPTRIHEWSKPIQESVNWFSNEVYRRIEDLAEQLEQQVLKIRKGISTSISKSLNKIKASKEKAEFLEKVTQDLNSMNEDLSGVNTVNDFVRTLKTHVGRLGDQISTNGLVVLTVDIKFDPRLPFKLVSWVAPFERLLYRFLTTKHSAHVEYLGQLGESDRETYKASLKSMEEQLKREKDDQTKRINDLEGRSAVEAQRLQNEIARIKEEHAQKLANNTEVMESSARMIRKLEANLSDMDKGNLWEAIGKVIEKVQNVIKTLVVPIIGLIAV